MMGLGQQWKVAAKKYRHSFHRALANNAKMAGGVARFMLDQQAAKKRLAEAERLLREFEWTYIGSMGYCKICRSLYRDGHKDDCELGKFLEGEK